MTQSHTSKGMNHFEAEHILLISVIMTKGHYHRGFNVSGCTTFISDKHPPLYSL